MEDDGFDTIHPETPLDPDEREKWRARSRIKTALLNCGQEIESLSGTRLNLAAGLPANAVWLESNFD